MKLPMDNSTPISFQVPAIACLWRIERSDDLTFDGAYKAVLEQSLSYLLDDPAGKIIRLQAISEIARHEARRPEDDDHDVGFAITEWHINSGVTLRHFHPPGNNDWLFARTLWSLISVQDEWTNLLDFGTNMYQTTMEEAAKAIMGKQEE
jgi:hypothetical protein